MSSVVISGDTSGTVSLTVPAVAGTNTATLPAATGTVMVSGNQPAFSVYLNGNQSVSNGAFVKVAYNTEEFDTANAFDSTTNYRFTPQVAGYYQLNAAVSVNGTLLTTIIPAIFKNGTQYKWGTQITTSTSTLEGLVSCLVYFNGSTDYAEIYCYTAATSGNVFGGSSYITWFNGVLVRTA